MQKLPDSGGLLVENSHDGRFRFFVLGSDYSYTVVTMASKRFVIGAQDRVRE